MWRYPFFRLATWIVPHLGESLGYWLFARIADVIFLVAWRTRRLVEQNVSQALGPRSSRSVVRRLARRAFWNLLWNYYEMFHMPALSVERLRARIQLEGTEYGESEAGSGRGAIFVFPHIGNLEVLMQIPLLYPQYRFVMLVERMTDDRLFKLMNGLRASQGLQVVATNEMLKIVRLLKQGWNLVLAGDFDSTGSGIIVDFLGAPARMPDGAVRLALRTGLPLLIAYGWQEPADARGTGKQRPHTQIRFRLCVTQPVHLPRSSDFNSDVRQGVQEVVGRLEPLIAAHLDQWLAFHPIWKETEQ